MRLRLTSPADADLAEAVDWYEVQEAGLGGRFLDDFERALDRIRANPWQFPHVREPWRGARFHRFPYRLIFRVFPDEVEIIACFHASRDPRRWTGRG